MKTSNPPQAVDSKDASDSKSTGRIESTDLFRGEKSVLIEHMGTCYRLQITKLGKLILTK